MTSPPSPVRGAPDPQRLAGAQAAHRALLEKWRHAMDLVGPAPIDTHFQDSASAVAALEAGGRWVDLGSGAGFPGIALAGLYPEAHVELVESRRKRSMFLEKVVYEAGLTNATVRNMRSEKLASDHYDGVISRAYKPPRKVLADAARLLVDGGRVVLLLGGQADIDTPLGWTELRRDVYAVGDGRRLRVVLQRDARD